MVLVTAVASCRSTPPAVPGPSGLATGTVTELDVGLTPDERERLRFLTEGSDLVPVVLLQALKDFRTGKLFADALSDYGFLPSPVSELNPDGLAVGWTVDVPALSPHKLPYAGLNCAACHTGQIEFQGRTLRIDGAPNMADIEALGLAVRDSLAKTLASRAETLALVTRIAQRVPPDAGIAAERLLPDDTRTFLANLEASVQGGGALTDTVMAEELGGAMQRLMRGEQGPIDEEVARVAGSGVASDERRAIRTALEVFATYIPVVKNRLGFALRALRAIETSPTAGPGRDDPWGLVRNVLFEQETRLTAATSIPSLFHFESFDWYHADGNTTSVMQRDFAQAVALGGYVDEATGESSLRPRNMQALELLWRKVKSPAWPDEVLGAIDRVRAARGEALFQKTLADPDGREASCADCHSSASSVLFPLATIATDPNRARSFQQPLNGRPFPEQLVGGLTAIMQTAYARAGVSAEEAESWELRPVAWRATGQYVARRLDGVWATAPYLHNGSVPSLYDLLLPPAARPRTFPLGHREYDPRNVGYTTAVADPVFTFDASIAGNGNQGHEYGTGLTDDERRDLVEYLKTR
jgi:mono/diheme cytochrome c family protein